MDAAIGLPALGGLDGIELKVNVGADQIDAALGVFGLGADAGKARRIWFGEVLDGLDGPGALPLSARGVILRVRAKKSGGDVTVKLRMPDGGIDVRAWRDGAGGSSEAKIEGDWASARLVSASLGGELDVAQVASLDAEPGSLAMLLSPPQRSLAQQLMVPLEHVVLLGPITARKWDAVADGDVAAELWEVGTLRFLEISLLVTQNPDAALNGLRRRAADGGLDLAARQEPKTATVLRLLATGQR